jgi:RNA polymerase sigma-70 factor (ECF subfamily)
VGRQHELYDAVVAEFGPALDRLASGYEADREKRRDLRQEIHLQIWRSLAVFDERCSLKTWTFRVAHNTAVSWVNKERRKAAGLVRLEEIEITAVGEARERDLDQQRLLQQLSELIRRLSPLDRQIMLLYLEEMDASAISAITGLSTGNVAMKIHRIKNILARQFLQEQHNV